MTTKTNTSYNAIIEVDRRDTTTDDVDDILDQLETYHASLSESARGFLEATITLPATSLAQASATAIAVVEKATGAPAIAAELMTTAEFDRRFGFEVVPDLVSVTEAAEILGVSRQAIAQRIQSKTLAAVQIGSTWAIVRSSLRPGQPGRRPSA
ncbi:hypothetical protein GCM10022215_23980 [Nocardioides fonticola]|uniref:Helix-turn-helix domain-containing protein n=1 Tax=Nocardioides fonticola TaxID=450363 RepID=A0ABP7XM70_9ACTN